MGRAERKKLRGGHVYKHGLSYTRIYKIWYGMHQRCYNCKNPRFKDYGGRGIKVCKRWHDLLAFVSDMGHPPKNRTLDRIDNDKFYSKNNCRWATPKMQSNNTKRNVFVTFEGRTLSYSQWARRLGFCRSTIRHRILFRGWTIEKALTTPKDKRGVARGRQD